MDGRLAGGALDLLVALVSNEEDVVVLGGEAPGLVVDLVTSGQVASIVFSSRSAA